MDDTDPQPGNEGASTPPPFGTSFEATDQLADKGVTFTPTDGAEVTPGAPSGEVEAPAPASTTEAFKAGAQKLTGQASDQVRTLADQGKARATGALDQVVQLLNDAAAQVEDKLGAQYGNYARQAAGQVSGVADQIRAKDVDELLDDVRGLVARAPGVAIGVSAALGFVVARLVSAGLDGRDAA